MSKPAPLTVFLPTYNRPDYTLGALKSCLDQTYENFRILISDDTPGDAVRKIVESMPSDKVSYTHNDPQHGIIKKLNDFIDTCPTEWAVVLGDDDWFEPSYLEAMVRLIEKYPQASLIRTRYRIFDAKSRFLKNDEAEKEVLSPFEAFGSYFKPWYKTHINISGVLFKPALIRKAGGFENYAGGHHVDQIAWARMAAYGDTIFCPDPLVNLRLFDPRAFSKLRDFNIERFMKAKVTAERDIQTLYETLRTRAANAYDREKLEEGRFLAGEFLKTFIDFHINEILVHLLKDRFVPTNEIKNAIRIVREGGIKNTRRFVYYDAVSALPYKVRRLALSLYLRGRHFLERIFPPETFSAR